jgi:RNA polymerase sigma-70 factor (ECF subfamily)
MSTDVTANAGSLPEQTWREVIAQLRVFVHRRIADPDRAEDLVADILLRVHRSIGTLDDRERLAHWVSRVARNAVVDEYRRAGRAREQLSGMLAVEVVEEPDDDPSGALDELAGCLRPLLGGLAPEQRRAVEMVDLDGMAQAAAARVEGVSLSGMKSRVQRGRRRLAVLLGQCCKLTLDARGVPVGYTPSRDDDGDGDSGGGCGCG